MPDSWLFGMPDELKRLGLAISAKRPWKDDIDKDCELIIAMGYYPTWCFYAKEKDRENPTWKVGGRKIIAHVLDVYKHRYELDEYYIEQFSDWFEFLKT